MSAGRFNLSALAVRERSVTLFLIILISVAGLVAFFGLGRAEDPPFTVKQMTVITVWPGATAQEMQDQVAGAAGKTAPGAKVVRSHGDLYPPWHGVDHPVAAGSDPAFRGAGAVLSGAQEAGRRGEKSACRRLRPDDE